MATKLRITSLKFISAVDAGAQGPISNVALVKRAAAGDEYSLTAKVAKVDETIGVVFGYAVASTVDGGVSPHIDYQGDAVVGGDELIKVALGFAEAGGQSDVMHDCVKDGWVPFVMPLNAETKKAFKLAGDVEGIAIGMKPSVETFKRFVSGELGAFSIYGVGERTPLEQGKRAPSKTQKRGLLTTAVEGHSHLLDDGDGAGAGYTSCECMGEGEGATYHSHPWSRNDAGAIVIGMSAGHAHDVLDPANAVESTVEESKRAKPAIGKSTLAAPKPHGGDTMKLVVLTESQHAHYSKLSGDDAEQFIAKSLTERETIVKAALDADAPIFKGELTGTEVRKSDGALALVLAKQAEANAKTMAVQTTDIAKAREERQFEIYKARAKSDLSNLAGSDDDKIGLLKSIDGEQDQAKRDAQLAILKGANAAMEKLGTMNGEGAGAGASTGASSDDAMASLEKGLKTFCKAQSITKNLWTDGLAAFVKTTEGAALKHALDESTAG